MARCHVIAPVLRTSDDKRADLGSGKLSASS
jgi:hypothetical protein